MSTLSDEERWLLQEARTAHRVKYPSVIRRSGPRSGRRSAASRSEGPTLAAGSRPTSDRARSGWTATRSTPPWPRTRSSAPGGSGREGCASRQPQALSAARDRLGNRVRFHAWLQFVAQEQWNAVRAIARAEGVLLAGDEPFIIGQDSADTRANPRHLRRDARGCSPRRVLGHRSGLGAPLLRLRGHGEGRLGPAPAPGASCRGGLRPAPGGTTRWATSASTSGTRRPPRGRFLPPEEPRAAATGRAHLPAPSEGSGIVAEDLGVIPPFVRKTLTQLQHPRLPGAALGKGRTGLPGTPPVPRGLRWSPPAPTTPRPCTSGGRRWTTPKRTAAAQAWPEFEGLRPPPAQFTPEVHARLLGHGRGRRLAAVRAAVAGRAGGDRAHQLSRARWATPTGRTGSRRRWRSWRAGTTCERRPPGCGDPGRGSTHRRMSPGQRQRLGRCSRWRSVPARESSRSRTSRPSSP